MDSRVVVGKDLAEVRVNLKNYLNDVLKERLDALEAGKKVIIGLSGGTMPSILSPVIRDLEGVDWSKVKFFSVDERMVPLADDDSNTGHYVKHMPSELKSHWPQFGPIDDPKLCASNYEAHIRAWHPVKTDDGWPVFDLIFLGLGPDGHTCSLFPGHPLLKESSCWIAPIEDSPKPPSRRITVTLPVINHARNVAFIALGGQKAAVIKEIVKDKSTAYPGGLVQPTKGKLAWFLDTDAAAQL